MSRDGPISGDEGDPSYLRRRASQERGLAVRASEPSAAKAHRRLAELYAERIARLDTAMETRDRDAI